jgi:hypothetical protein
MWYLKLFRRLLNATFLNSLVIYRQNVRRNVDDLKFRNDFIEGLLVKYSVLCGMSGHHDDDIIIETNGPPLFKKNTSHRNEM